MRLKIVFPDQPHPPHTHWSQAPALGTYPLSLQMKVVPRGGPEQQFWCFEEGARVRCSPNQNPKLCLLIYSTNTEHKG